MVKVKKYKIGINHFRNSKVSPLTILGTNGKKIERNRIYFQVNYRGTNTQLKSYPSQWLEGTVSLQSYQLSEIEKFESIVIEKDKEIIDRVLQLMDKKEMKFDIPTFKSVYHWGSINSILYLDKWFIDDFLDFLESEKKARSKDYFQEYYDRNEKLSSHRIDFEYPLIFYFLEVLDEMNTALYKKFLTVVNPEFAVFKAFWKIFDLKIGWANYMPYFPMINFYDPVGVETLRASLSERKISTQDIELFISFAQRNTDYF